MISEAVVTAQVKSERITRDSSVQLDEPQQKNESDIEQQSQGFSDVTNFSAEALALSRKVTEISGSAEQKEVEPSQQNLQETAGLILKSLDIRA